MGSRIGGKMDGAIKYIMENIQKNISFDVTSVLNRAIDVVEKVKDKELICQRLAHLDQLDHELVMRLIDHSERVLDKVIELVQRKEAEYIRAGKWQKVFGFAKWSSIYTNAFNAAILDVRQILSIANPFDNPDVKKILEMRSTTHNMLTSHLSNMLAAEPIKKLDFKGINKILGLEEE